jgi:hypothetical protein
MLFLEGKKSIPKSAPALSAGGFRILNTVGNG